MTYRLTSYTDITNTGSNITVMEFDSHYELSDYLLGITEGMSEDDKEIYYYNSNIEEI